MIKKGAVGAITMLLLCSLFIFSTEFARRADIDAVCEYMLSLEGYRNSELVENPTGAYAQIYSVGVGELRVYKSTDGSAKEFAVAETDGDGKMSQKVIDIMNMRTDELEAEFSGNEREEKRIDSARIILADRFLIYTVYDTEGVAENAVYKYFSMR